MTDWTYVWRALEEERAVFSPRWLDVYRVPSTGPGERPTDHERGVPFEEVASAAEGHGITGFSRPLDKEQTRKLIEQLARAQASKIVEALNPPAEVGRLDDSTMNAVPAPVEGDGSEQNDMARQPGPAEASAGPPASVDTGASVDANAHAAETPSAEAPENSTAARRRILKLSDLVLDGGTQHRVSLNEDVVEHMIEKMGEGDQFPAVTVYHVAGRYLLADGFTRTEAHRRLGREDIEADVIEGSEKDARVYSYGANDKHGQHRTRADKRRVVDDMLNDPALKDATLRELARIGRVSRPLIDSILAERALASEGRQPAAEDMAEEKSTRPTMSQNFDAPQSTRGGSSATSVHEAAAQSVRYVAIESSDGGRAAGGGSSATLGGSAADQLANDSSNIASLDKGGRTATPGREEFIQTGQDPDAERRGKAGAKNRSVSQLIANGGQSLLASGTDREASVQDGEPRENQSTQQIPTVAQSLENVQPRTAVLNVATPAASAGSVQADELPSAGRRDEIDHLQHRLEQAHQVIAKFHKWAKTNFLLLTAEMIELEHRFDDEVTRLAVQEFISVARDRATEGEALSEWTSD